MDCFGGDITRKSIPPKTIFEGSFNKATIKRGETVFSVNPSHSQKGTGAKLSGFRGTLQPLFLFHLQVLLKSRVSFTGAPGSPMQSAPRTSEYFNSRTRCRASSEFGFLDVDGAGLVQVPQ